MEENASMEEQASELIQQQQAQPIMDGIIYQSSQAEPVAVGGPGARVVISRDALRELMEILRQPSSPEQQNQILQILRNNPPLMDAFLKQREAMQQQQQLQQQQLLQQQLLQSQQQSQLAMNACADQVNVNAINRQAVLQLKEILKSPNTPEQQKQILYILKSNPPLMAAFVKRKQAQAMQLRQQQQQQVQDDVQQVVDAISKLSTLEI